MGNLGKIKKKMKQANSLEVKITDKGMDLLKRLGISYSRLLEKREWQKAEVMVNWAKQTQDPVMVGAIDLFNRFVIKKLNLKTNYSTLPLKQQLSFLLENQEYVQQHFSTYEANEVTELSVESTKIEQAQEQVYGEKSDKLLMDYLNIIEPANEREQLIDILLGKSKR